MSDNPRRICTAKRLIYCAHFLTDVPLSADILIIALGINFSQYGWLPISKYLTSLIFKIWRVDNWVQNTDEYLSRVYLNFSWQSHLFSSYFVQDALSPISKLLGQITEDIMID